MGVFIESLLGHMSACSRRALVITVMSDGDGDFVWDQVLVCHFLLRKLLNNPLSQSCFDDSDA